jgi:hypothetical protein
MVQTPMWKPGQVIAVRGDGAIVVVDWVTAPEFGMTFGHIVGPDGTRYSPKDLLNLMKFNIWDQPGPEDPQWSEPWSIDDFPAPWRSSSGRPHTDGA